MGCDSCIGIFAQDCTDEVRLHTSNTPAIGCSYCSTPYQCTLLIHFQWMFRTFCEFSPNYLATLRQLSNPEGLKLADCIVQFPFVAPVSLRSTIGHHVRLTRRAGREVDGGTREASTEAQRGRPASTRNGDYETKGEGNLC
jgi:hypothetical protein